MRLQTAISNVKKCFVAPDQIVKSKLNDELTFLISITVIDNAIKKGIVGLDTVEQYIKGEIDDILFS